MSGSIEGEAPHGPPDPNARVARSAPARAQRSGVRFIGAIALSAGVLRAGVLCAGVLCAGACGSTKPPPARSPGNVMDPPSVLVLPQADVPDEQLSGKMRQALELADESMAMRLPEPPAKQDIQSLSDWSNGRLRYWVTEKRSAISYAEEALDRASYASHRELIVAGAVLALVYEDAARQVARIPVPEEARKDEAALDLYWSLTRRQARPYARRAKRAYRACAKNAEHGPEGMRHWSLFCQGRRQRLKAVFPKRERHNAMKVHTSSDT